MEGYPVTPRAARKTVTMLAEMRDRGALIDGDAYPDMDGGLTCDWDNGGRAVHLVIHGHAPREDYLYWQYKDAKTKAGYNIEWPLTGDVLERRLRWVGEGEPSSHAEAVTQNGTPAA